MINLTLSATSWKVGHAGCFFFFFLVLVSKSDISHFMRMRWNKPIPLQHFIIATLIPTKVPSLSFSTTKVIEYRIKRYKSRQPICRILEHYTKYIVETKNQSQISILRYIHLYLQDSFSFHNEVSVVKNSETGIQSLKLFS